MNAVEFGWKNDSRLDVQIVSVFEMVRRARAS